MDDIVHQYKQMGIAEDKEELIFDDDDERHTANDGKMTFPLVGKVLTDRKIKLQIFKKLMASLWRPVKGVSTKEIGGNKWLVEGFSSTGMRVLQRSDSQGTGGQGWKVATIGTRDSSIKEGNSVSPREVSRVQKDMGREGRGGCRRRGHGTGQAKKRRGGEPQPLGLPDCGRILDRPFGGLWRDT
ncbi:unnamed protein product [Cuscuta epithymum]|uniref:Uncharacterized protein n=1 Tax=Cuscuta epithymum TaxID=186058 RepID=A0AAV0CBU7_9ASTE|nr:unnamed protein product [Cuscuta epithymum]